MFLCEFREIAKNNFFSEQLLTTASADSNFINLLTQKLQFTILSLDILSSLFNNPFNTKCLNTLTIISLLKLRFSKDEKVIFLIYVCILFIVLSSTDKLLISF